MLDVIKCRCQGVESNVFYFEEKKQMFSDSCLFDGNIETSLVLGHI